MPVFLYRARDSSGNAVTGELELEHAQAVKMALVQKGIFPIAVEEKKAEITHKLKQLEFFKKKAQAKDLANFTRQFQILFAVGMPMDKTLQTLAAQAQIPDFKEALTQIHLDVAGGMRLSAAFAKHPRYFNTLYTSMLEMGQIGGVLDKTLKEMTSVLEKEHTIRSKVKSALLYPKIVTGTLLVVGWAMLAFVFPPFQAFYAGQGAQLPLPTKIVMFASTMATTYWYVLVSAIAGAMISWKFFKASEGGKRWVSKMSFKIPIFGNLNLLVANSRFGHLVSSLYRSGLPLPQSLGVVAAAMTNILYAEEVLHLKKSIEHGQSLSRSMEGTQYFAAMVREACAVGEQTGKLDVVLDSTATYYDSEIEELLKNLTTLIEPIMLVFLFGAVLLLALAVYMPVWNMSKVVLHG